MKNASTVLKLGMGERQLEGQQRGRHGHECSSKDPRPSFIIGRGPYFSTRNAPKKKNARTCAGLYRRGGRSRAKAPPALDLWLPLVFFLKGRPCPIPFSSTWRREKILGAAPFVVCKRGLSLPTPS